VSVSQLFIQHEMATVTEQVQTTAPTAVDPTTTDAADATAATTAVADQAQTQVTVGAPQNTVKAVPLASSNSYALAMSRVAAGFEAGYLNDQMTPEQKEQTIQSIAPSKQLFCTLCEQYLLPVFQELEAKLSMPQPVGAAAVVKPHKPLTDWQVFLKYAKEIIPGYAASNQKMKLAKEAYKAYSAEERTALKQRYYQENPQAATAAAQAPAAAAKSKRGPTGFSLYSKNWYEAFKKANPDASGLQSKACGAAWKALSKDEQQQWKAAAAAQNAQQ